MIIEIDERKPKDGVVVFEGGRFRIIPKEEYTKELTIRLKKAENEIERLNDRLAVYDNLKIVETIRKYTDKFDNDKTKNNLVRYMAFELLNDDININGENYPDNYNEIKEWVFNPVGDAPKELMKYIYMVDPKEE